MLLIYSLNCWLQSSAPGLFFEKSCRCHLLQSDCWIFTSLNYLISLFFFSGPSPAQWSSSVWIQGWVQHQTVLLVYFIRRKTPDIVNLLDCTMAFDKCRFDSLFKKLLDRNVPLVDLRASCMCTKSHMHWWSGGMRSPGCSGFSPSLFSVYMDNLLSCVRKSGVGCHVGGVFAGAVWYADDLLLLAPSRSEMQKMLKICEEYAMENNRQFSTGPWTRT